MSDLSPFIVFHRNKFVRYRKQEGIDDVEDELEMMPLKLLTPNFLFLESL